VPAQRLPARRAVRFATEFLEPEGPVFTAEDVDAMRPVGAFERGENLAGHVRVDLHPLDGIRLHPETLAMAPYERLR